MGCVIPAARAVYPSHLLEEAESALFLFGAGFHGANDVAWAYAAGLSRVTVVDTDAEKVAAMEADYPDDWCFAVADAVGFAEMERAFEARYDVVTADPYTGTAMRRCHEHIDLLLAIAERALVVGVESGEEIDVPSGWRGSRMVRSPLADWLVLERA